MRFRLFLFTFILPLFSYAQELKGIPYIDSLYLELIANKDTSHVLDLNIPVFDLAQGNRDTTLFYAKEMVAISRKIEFAKGVALGYNNMGLAYEMNGEIDSGLYYYNLAAEVAKTVKNSPKTAANIYNNISIAYSYKGEMQKSIEYLLKTISIAEAYHDTTQMATAYNNLGLRYIEMNSPQIALKYIRKALNYNISVGNRRKIGLNYMNIGSSHVMLKAYDSATAYLRQSITILEETGQDYNRLISYQLMANMYYTKNQYDSAAFFNQIAIDLGHQLEDSVLLNDSQRLKAMLFLKEGKYKQAIPILEQAVTYSETIDYRSQMAENYKYLAIAQAAAGNYEKSQKYYALTLNYMDSVVMLKTGEAQMKLAEFQEEINRSALEEAEKDIQIQRLRAERSETISWAAGISGALLLVVLGGLYNRYKLINSTSKVIEKERDRSDKLLLNILPAEIAEELKEKGKAEARQFNEVTILFTDFKNFTQFAAKLTPSEVVSEIDKCYRAFDEIISKYSIEKIKTIGDAYMAASGLPMANPEHAQDMVKAAREIQAFMKNYIDEKKKNNAPYYEIRIGMHSGPVVAGIVGIKKFAYDIWGDTVNIAARMESNSVPGKINISETTHALIKSDWKCISRGPIDVKGKGELQMYFIDHPLHPSPA